MTEVDVPTEIGYGKVIGRFVKFVADTADVGTTPNEVPLNGSVLIAPMTQIMRWPAVAPPRLAVASTVDCPVVNGDLCAPGTTVPGVYLVATDQPGAQPMIIQWRATFHLTGVTVQPAAVVFDVPIGGEVDLALAVSIPPEPPSVIVVSTESAVSAAQSALEAELAAAQADADRVAAQAAAAAAAADAAAAAQAAAAADADAQAAADSAEDAQVNLTDVVRFSPQTIAPADQRQGRLNISSVGKDELVYNVRDHGAVGDGVADDSAAINAAAIAAASFGLRLYASGTFKINSTVFLIGASDLSLATFNWAGTSGPAVHVGAADGAGSPLRRIGRVELPFVNNTWKTSTGWDQPNTVGSVGVKVQRLYDSRVTHKIVLGFETGLLVYGKIDGVQMVTFDLGTPQNNKVNLKLDTDGAGGWVNQNWFFGGYFNHSTPESAGPILPGTKHLHITRSGGSTGAPNTNTFWGVSFETRFAEWQIDLDEGSNNVFYNCRFEAGSLTNGRIRFGAGAFENTVHLGYNSNSMDVTRVAGSTYNNVYGTTVENRTVFRSMWEARSSLSTAMLTFLRPGALVAGDDPATAYTSSFSCDAWRMKSYNDAFDRMRFTAGRIWLGNGTADPTAGFSANTTTITAYGTLQPDTDATRDLGSATSPKWRNVHTTGGTSKGIRTATSTGNISSTDSTVLANNAATITLSLPAATSFTGREYRVRSIGAGSVTIASLGGNVDGGASVSIAAGGKAMFQSNGTDWYVVG